MKNNKLMLSMVPILAVGLLTGCKPDSGRKIDNSKTQLKVAAIRSGVEDAWLQDLAGRFMEKYKDYSFEPGKTGIQVWVDGDKTAYNGDQLTKKIKTDNHQVYCVENVQYNSFLNPEKLVMNLKDIISVDASDGNEFYTEEKSILDRMDPRFRDAFELTNGDIYMIPYYESFCSFQYDRDVFNNPRTTKNNKSFYLKRSDLVIAAKASLADQYADVQNIGDVAPIYDDFEYNEQINYNDFFCDVDEDPTHRNYGPDGIAGTFDDGLPQTFKEFEILSTFMKSAGYQTILGNDTYNYYIADMLASVWANEEGIDNINMNFSWEGTATDLIKIENNKIVVDSDGQPVYSDPLTITSENATELHRQEGVYRALQFADIMTKSVEQNDLKKYAFTAAQNALIRTKFNTQDKYYFGTLVDGNWWENESKLTFSKKTTDSNYRLNRNFSFFTFPKSTSAKWDSTRGKMTYYNINSSTCFLNKNLETTHANQMEAAKAFFYYINSNEGMSAFTANTSITRPFEYSLTPADELITPSYGKDMLKLRHYFSDQTGATKGYNICTTYPLSDAVAAKENKVHKYEWNFQCDELSATQEAAIPVDVMYKKGCTAEEYFVKSYKYMVDKEHVYNN